MVDHKTALYQTAHIKELEKLAEAAGLSETILMQRAGAAALNVLRTHWPKAKSVAVFCGKGNNGGDGYVLAKLARAQGLQVVVYQMAASQAAKACQDAGINVKLFSENEIITADIIVDALLGTGINSEVKGDYKKAIEKINQTNKPILALDVPSGLNADTGNIFGVAVIATATIIFIGLKPGLFTAKGPAYSGEVHCDALEIPPEIFAKVSSDATLLDFSEVTAALQQRRCDAHKGDFGHVLVIGGDYGMPGAVRMAAEAAARVGSGLTTVATHPEHVPAIVSERPELMCQPVASEKDLIPLLKKATVIVLGPGLGQSEWSLQLWQIAMETDLPKILDADALNLLAKHPNMHDNWILTPHPGEAARLLGITTPQIQADRFAAAKSLQERYGGICVLKGVGSLVQGKTIPGVCPAGNPGMASGGMGDVLSGVIGGLVAQKLALETAARVGVYIHALAADQAALEGGQRGLLALDLMPYLQRLVNP